MKCLEKKMVGLVWNLRYEKIPNLGYVIKIKIVKLSIWPINFFLGDGIMSNIKDIWVKALTPYLTCSLLY